MKTSALRTRGATELRSLEDLSKAYLELRQTSPSAILHPAFLPMDGPDRTGLDLLLDQIEIRIRLQLKPRSELEKNPDPRDVKPPFWKKILGYIH